MLKNAVHIATQNERDTWTNNEIISKSAEGDAGRYEYMLTT